MIPVRELTSAAEVYANAKRLQNVFFRPRQIALAQVIPAPKEAASEDVSPSTPAVQLGSGTTSDETVAAPTGNEVSEWVERNRSKWLEVSQSDALKNSARALQIVSAIAAESGMTAEDLFSPSRASRVIRPRHKAMAAIYLEFPQWPLVKIGKLFGGRDHTTVLYAVRKMGVYQGAEA